MSAIIFLVCLVLEQNSGFSEVPSGTSTPDNSAYLVKSRLSAVNYIKISIYMVFEANNLAHL